MCEGYIIVEHVQLRYIYSFVRERYNCVKYKNSPYYKGSIIWDNLPVIVRNSMSLTVFKKHLKNIYSRYCDSLS